LAEGVEELAVSAADAKAHWASTVAVNHCMSVRVGVLYSRCKRKITVGLFAAAGTNSARGLRWNTSQCDTD